MTEDADVPSDEHLVQQTLAGDDGAFAMLARRYRARIAGMAARFASDSHEADDLIQEIFLRVWRKLRQFRGVVPFEHWLLRLATRQCYDLLRRRYRRREETLDPEHWDRLADLSTRTEDAQAAREFLDLALRRLKPEERLVITLLELEEHSVRETSRLTGWSEASVKVRAFRARKKLKTILEQLDESR